MPFVAVIKYAKDITVICKPGIFFLVTRRVPTVPQIRQAIWGDIRNTSERSTLWKSAKEQRWRAYMMALSLEALKNSWNTACVIFCYEKEA